MNKSNSFFQIGEVAHLLDVGRKTILHYETMGLISPAYVDENSGYRYFDIEAIAKLQLVLDLRQADMPIKQVENYLKGKLTAEAQIEAFTEKIKQIEVAIEMLSMRSFKGQNVSEVSEKILPAQYCVCRNYVVKDIEAGIEALSGMCFDCLKKKLRFAKNANHFCEFPKDILSNDLYDTTDIEMKVCIAVEKQDNIDGLEFFPETKAACVSFIGSYENGVVAYEAIKKHIVENNLTVSGYPREFYLEGNFDNSHDNNIVWVAVPIL